MLPYKISLTYGDPTNDGHGMSTTCYYKSSHTTSQIKGAVYTAERKYNFSFTSEICADYHECTLTTEQLQLFTTIGINISKYVDSDPDWIYVHDFTGLYLAIAKTELPDLITESIEDNADNIDIGGYGMLPG